MKDFKKLNYRYSLSIKAWTNEYLAMVYATQARRIIDINNDLDDRKDWQAPVRGWEMVASQVLRLILETNYLKKELLIRKLKVPRIRI